MFMARQFSSAGPGKRRAFLKPEQQDGSTTASPRRALTGRLHTVEGPESIGRWYRSSFSGRLALWNAFPISSGSGRRTARRRGSCIAGAVAQLHCDRHDDSRRSTPRCNRSTLRIVVECPQAGKNAGEERP